MPETRPSARTRRLSLAVVVIAALAVHARTIGFGFSHLDDDVLIVDRQAELARPSAVWRAFTRPYLPPSGRDHAYYRPLVTASYALDAAWSGAGPRGYHTTNVLLAALGAGLLFHLLLAFGHGAGVAMFGGLVYAVHPALAETVAWIPGRPDGLLVVFALAAWLPLGRALEPGRWASRLGHLLALLAALLCKESAVVLPLAYAGHRVVVERRPLRSLAAPWLLAGWAAVLALVLVARARVLPDALGAAGVTAGSFAGGLSLLAASLGKLLLPVNLAVMATPEDSWLWPGVAAAAVLVAVAFVPGIRRPHLLFGLACFVLFVLPGAPASRMLTLESRLALPAVGIVVAVAEIARRLPPGRGRFAAGAVVIAGLAAVTFSYAANFRDRLSFAQAAVRGAPHAAQAHRNLGVAYHLAGETVMARQSYLAAVAEDAAEPVVHNNLAVLLMAEGRLPEAEQELRLELAVNPQYAVAHDNLARVLAALGRAPEAAQEEAIAAQLRRGGVGAGR
jgi:tetratricopeptide (TPR) repeat protein